MKKNIRTTILTLSALGAGILLAGCGAKEPAEGADSAAASARAGESGLVLAERPAEAIPVGRARLEAEPGQAVVVTGQVGGTRKPIAEGYAALVLADQAVDFCNELGDEHCATPWDACCEDPDKLAANRLSVVFVDSGGRPLSIDLRGDAKLSELDRITVTGTVASESTPENLVIYADGFYRAGSTGQETGS